MNLKPGANLEPNDMVVVNVTVKRRDPSGLVPAADVPVALYWDYGTSREKLAGEMVTREDGTTFLETWAGSPGETHTLTVVARDTELLTGSRTENVTVHFRYTPGMWVDAGPNPHAYGTPMTVTGNLTNGDTGWIGDALMIVEFSPDGKKGWRRITERNTRPTWADGFRFSFGKITKDGYWRLRYPGYAGSLPAVSIPQYVDVRYRTQVSGFNASPEPVKKGKAVTVTGRLSRYVPNAKPGAGAVVYVYFKAKGHSTWTQMAVAKTDAKGRFKKALKVSKDGTWMAMYKGNSTYMKSNAPSDYVDVR
ncbi:hypothetical protein ACGFNU_33590 [Spirillospora sp. NPDC048911]|uniref:hypothetical protein n=1 Tax=Spirillospora sp. NPDC048911 TaxID=3364527 RepID=UPI00371B883D